MWVITLHLIYIVKIELAEQKKLIKTFTDVYDGGKKLFQVFGCLLLSSRGFRTQFHSSLPKLQGKKCNNFHKFLIIKTKEFKETFDLLSLYLSGTHKNV